MSPKKGARTQKGRNLVFQSHHVSGDSVDGSKVWPGMFLKPCKHWEKNYQPQLVSLPDFSTIHSMLVFPGSNFTRTSFFQVTFRWPQNGGHLTIHPWKGHLEQKHPSLGHLNGRILEALDAATSQKFRNLHTIFVAFLQPFGGSEGGDGGAALPGVPCRPTNLESSPQKKKIWRYGIFPGFWWGGLHGRKMWVSGRVDLSSIPVGSWRF